MNGLENIFRANGKHCVSFVDRCLGEVFVGKVPSSWETAPEGRSALLRAARDADDTVLGEIAAQVRKFGFRDTDVNMADSSGRVSAPLTVHSNETEELYKFSGTRCAC